MHKIERFVKMIPEWTQGEQDKSRKKAERLSNISIARGKLKNDGKGTHDPSIDELRITPCVLVRNVTRTSVPVRRKLHAPKRSMHRCDEPY